MPLRCRECAEDLEHDGLQDTTGEALVDEDGQERQEEAQDDKKDLLHASILSSGRPPANSGQMTRWVIEQDPDTAHRAHQRCGYLLLRRTHTAADVRG